MPALLVLLFIVVPLVELAILIQVGQVIGVPWTIAALVAVSVLGAWLVRREGPRAWRRFREALDQGRLPTDEVIEGALVLFGGVLLLTPGFATDALGLSLMLPPLRAVIAATLKRRLGARMSISILGGDRTPRPSRDEIVDVEVINVERSGRDRAARNGEINSRDTG
jgi:UPF0716 protein FxsA